MTDSYALECMESSRRTNKMTAIRVENISRSYGAVQALDSISFSVEAGELFGLIGPDGAGKTTLFRILTTLLLADTGTATVTGFDVKKDMKSIRNSVGYMPGKFSLYQDLTVEENLELFATLFHTTIQENYHLIAPIYAQIEPFKNRRAGKLSGGMKQKLALSCALIHKPSVLFLDEPTTGVDPVSRKEFWQMLKDLRKEGITILVSTPYMDEAELCDRIALIDKGKILSIDTPNRIATALENPLVAVTGNPMHRLLATLRTFPMVVSAYTFGTSHHVTLTKNASAASLRDELAQFAFEGLQVLDIVPTVEDAFMAFAKPDVVEPQRTV